jgi:hypothetical protein
MLTEESDYSLADENGCVSIEGRELLSLMEGICHLQRP